MYFDDVELVLPLDEVLQSSICSRKTKKKWLLAANTEPGFVFVSCEYIDDPTNLKLVIYFCLYSASASELIQVKSVNKYFGTESETV